ncbi:MAG: PepSY domain-containing protein [Pseudomonadota bacterium]
MTKQRASRLAAALTALIALPVAALAVNVGETVSTEDAAIRAALEADGYEIVEIEREDDEIEVEATKGGQAFELSFDAESGQLTEIELEDGDED